MICPECNGKGEINYYRLVRDTHPVTVEGFLDICHTCRGSGVKIETNADHIRSMTDEDLAKAIYERVDTGACNDFGIPTRVDCDGKCRVCIRDWLKQPYKEDA